MKAFNPIRLAAVSVLVLSTCSCWAEQVKLDGNQIREFLSNATVGGQQNGNGWSQSFQRGGSTAYSASNLPGPSSGRWRVRGDQYCSQWPPSDRLDCYDLTVEGNQLTFIPAGGGQHWPAARQ